MDEVDQGELLFALLGELAARELSLKLARQCSLTPRSVVGDWQYEIPDDFDLCAHLPLDGSGTRSPSGGRRWCRPAWIWSSTA